MLVLQVSDMNEGMRQLSKFLPHLDLEESGRTGLHIPDQQALEVDAGTPRDN